MEEVRRIPEFLFNRAQEGGARCIFLKNADDLTVQEQNYLLKSLEEPAEGVVFVLSAAQSERLLPTVRSRCIEVRIRPLPKKELVRQLRQSMGSSRRPLPRRGQAAPMPRRRKSPAISSWQKCARARQKSVCAWRPRKILRFLRWRRKLCARKRAWRSCFMPWRRSCAMPYYQTGNLQLMNPG